MLDKFETKNMENPHTLYVKHLKQLDSYFQVASMKVMTLLAYSNQLKKNENAVEVFPLIPILHDSLQMDCVLTVTKFTENKRSQKNIHKFLNFAESNWAKIEWHEKFSGKLNPEKIHSQRNELRRIEPIIKGFQHQRDKFFAHYDNEYFFNPGKLSEAYPNKDKELLQVLNVLGDIIHEHQLHLTSACTVSLAEVCYQYVEYHSELMRDIQKNKK